MTEVYRETLTQARMVEALFQQFDGYLVYAPGRWLSACL